jgi:hypothetical protein
MRSSHLLYEFLTFPAEKMEKLRKNYDSMSVSRSLHTLKTDSGSIQLTLTNKLRSYLQHTIDYIRKVPKTHESISLSITRVMELLEETSKEIYKVVDYFA